MSNQVNVAAAQVDSFIPVQTNSHNNWYEYGNTFSNLVIDPLSESQLLIEQEIIDTNQNQRAKLLQRNVKKSNGTDRSFSCGECSATFSNSSNLKSHSRIHSGERPYVCDICGASFVQSSNMKAHKRIHTGERPYMCTECGQTFSRSSHLVGHKRTHTGERPYICGICHESFVTSTHLRSHMRKHTGERPFACKICECKFAQNGSLQIHLRIHTGERPFKCAKCSLAFRSKGDLHSHYKLHADSKPFRCSSCDKSFKVKQYLQKHKKKCGSPPTGKKRGRPKKNNGSQESILPKPNCNQMSSIKGKRPRLRSRSNSLKVLTDSEPELDSDDFYSFESLKSENINDFGTQNYVALTSNDHSMYLNGSKIASNSQQNHSHDTSHLGSFTCVSELSQSLIASHEIPASASIF